MPACWPCRIVSPREGCAALAARRADRLEPRAEPRRAAAPAPQPVLIDAAGHTCLAWWHAPAAIASTGLPLAVVMASSWGEEDLAAYDVQRALALELADAGLGTLRFEWPDTGDSSAATGSTTVAHALAAFDAAATRTLALSGQERLAFVGLRLGALLATHAASTRLDVDALVALDPVVGGRAFVREQRVLAAARWVPPRGTLFDPAELPVCLGGFALTVRRLEALSALRWPSAATTSVLEALLVQPAHAEGRAASDALARMGMRVRERAFDDVCGAPARSDVVRWLRERAGDATVLRGVPAIADFGEADPANARANAALARTRLDAATAAVLALARHDAPSWMRLRERGVALRERVVRLEDAGEPTLVGVLGERDRAGRDALAREAIVLLASGRERRVGPQRMWVAWARQRAAAGDVVLRLDVAGSGDSASRSQSADDDAGADLARAVAWLRREKGVSACTVVGIGEGATRAWRAALDGLAVQRVIAIDPTRLRRRRAPSARVTRALRLLRPSADPLALELARAAARGVSLNLVLSQSTAGLRLPPDSRVTTCRVAAMHPQFAGPADQMRLCARLDALLSPARPDDGASTVAEVRDARPLRPSFAAEALRVIARSSGQAR